MTSPTQTALRRRLAELVTVFLGVVLAFFADDFRERLSESRAEQVALSGLHADFEANARQISARTAQSRRLEATTGALKQLLDAAPQGASLVVPDTLLIGMVLGGDTYDPIRGTIDALMSSGELGLVRDPELRSAIAEWPAALADANDQEQASRIMLRDLAIPVVMRAAPEIDGVIEHYGAWSRGEAPAQAEGWTTRVANTPELRSVVALRLHHLSVTAGFLERLGAAEARLIDLLERAG